MRNKKQRIIIALCILFAILLIGTIFYSTCRVTETFEEKQKKSTSANTTAKSKADESSTKLKLSTKEQEIFNDLLSNKLTDINIDSLINTGVLTENMIERFLSKITKDSFVVPPPLEDNVNVPAKSKIVEGFTGFTSLTPMYATATSPETNQVHSQY